MSEQVASVSEMARILNERVAHDKDKVYSLQMLTFVAHFNFYRLLYPQLSFDDKKRLYKMYMELFPEYNDEKTSDSPFVLECFRLMRDAQAYKKQLPSEPFYVVELGGYQGELAKCVMKKFKGNWMSFDIIKHEILPDLDSHDFTEYVLSKELWESGVDLSHSDVFVSMHTLEHLCNTEFEKMVKYLLKQKIPYLILQIPLKPDGQDWGNFLGAHVLTYGSKQVKKMLEPHYTLVSEVAKGKRISEGWCSFWRLKK